MHFINEIFMSTAILIDEYWNFKELKYHEASMG